MNITLENIAFAYDKGAFLQDITAELAPGKVHFLAGPNGSGKSTLLKILAGYLAPDAGEVKLNDRDLTTYSGMERARHLGVMWQSSSPALDFTVREMVEITASARFPRLHKLSEADEKIIGNALASFGLSGLAQRRVNTLSGGERQRVMLAGMLALEPQVLLLDEPTSALDPAHRNQAFARLEEYARTHTVLVITHDLELLARAAGVVWLLDMPRNFYAGNAEEILTENILSKVYNAPAKVAMEESRRRIYFD